MTDKQLNFLCDTIIDLAGRLGSIELNNIGDLEAEIMKLEAIACALKGERNDN